MTSTVALIHDKNVKKGIVQALDSLGNLSSLFENRNVAVKPNDISPHDVKACTQPDSLKTVIKYVKKFNPKKITVVGGSGDDKTMNTFKAVGLDKVIKEENAEFFDLNQRPFETVKLSFGMEGEVKVNPKLFEFETIVSLAQHKVHEQAAVTLSIKNTAMGFPAAEYYGYAKSIKSHKNNYDLHEFIAAMFQKFPAQLGIIVGHPAMIVKGPTHGKTFESELIIASKDCVAADSVGAHLLGFNRVKHILDCEKLGLGNASLDNIEIAGISLNEAMKIFIERSRHAK